jgi:N6-adenosine-specific RNA methylase IME4
MAFKRATAGAGDPGDRQGIVSADLNSPTPADFAPTTQGLIRPLDEPGAPRLALYDHACAALAAAKSVDEVKEIVDVSVAMRAYAKQAKNRDLEADAVELRMRATRRLDQMRQAQAATVGLATGGEYGGRKRKDGVRNTPAIVHATLASQGIDKNLAKQGRILGALSDVKFETVVADARDKVSRAVRNAVREIEILQERESYRARTEQGGTVTDLEALAAAGKKFGVICPDFPWLFEAYSGKGKQRSAERRYDTWPLERILAMAPLIAQLAASDCALLLWTVWPEHPGALELIRACGFEYKSAGFVWVKTKPSATCITLDGDGLHWGMGYNTRSNTEACLLGTRGSPWRLSADVHQVVIAPAGEHSEKPDEVYRRIERLYGGPRLELFARKLRPGWLCWGNELPPPSINGGGVP